ncbi:hypothetical protein [Amycolatopsis coloradensis]|uniref:hypothetical protein n=1 Tax=Amycolatopsis coloradensis TaxID=76021 RepID=UPI0013017967|nr:hypothetical protein [Amycolatopsis coloradensis]
MGSRRAAVGGARVTTRTAGFAQEATPAYRSALGRRRRASPPQGSTHGAPPTTTEAQE